MAKKPTPDESYADIFKYNTAEYVCHLTFFMSRPDQNGNIKYLADHDTEDNTMFFSYNNVWSVFREGHGMTDDEIKIYLRKKMEVNYGIYVKPY